MWPKAFAQLVELAPHISRLLPMADRFFQSKASGEEANRKALDAIGEQLRAELNRVNNTHASLSGQISEVSNKLDRTAAAIDALEAQKLSVDSLERRLEAIEQTQRRVTYLCALALAGLLVVLVLAILIYVRGR